MNLNCQWRKIKIYNDFNIIFTKQQKRLQKDFHTHVNSPHTKLISHNFYRTWQQFSWITWLNFRKLIFIGKSWNSPFVILWKLLAKTSNLCLIFSLNSVSPLAVYMKFNSWHSWNPIGKLYREFFPFKYIFFALTSVFFTASEFCMMGNESERKIKH